MVRTDKTDRQTNRRGDELKTYLTCFHFSSTGNTISSQRSFQSMVPPKFLFHGSGNKSNTTCMCLFCSVLVYNVLPWWPTHATIPIVAVHQYYSTDIDYSLQLWSLDWFKTSIVGKYANCIERHTNIYYLDSHTLPEFHLYGSEYNFRLGHVGQLCGG